MKKIIIGIFVVMLLLSSNIVYANVQKSTEEIEKICINTNPKQTLGMGGMITPPWGWWGYSHQITVYEPGNLWWDDGTESGDAYEVEIYADQSCGAALIWPFPSTLEVTQKVYSLEKWYIPTSGYYSFRFDFDVSGDYYLFSQYLNEGGLIYYSIAMTETFVFFKVEDSDKNVLWDYTKRVNNDIASNGQKFGDSYSAHANKISDYMYFTKGEMVRLIGGIKVVTGTTGTIPAKVEGTHTGKLNYIEGDWPNDPPLKPTISGPGNGRTGQTYSYKIQTSDPEGDDISYYIDWGDGENTGWTTLYSSGTQITRSHSWDYSNTFTVKAKAKDEYGEESSWAYLTVNIPRNRESQTIIPNTLQNIVLITK